MREGYIVVLRQPSGKRTYIDNEGLFGRDGLPVMVSVSPAREDALVFDALSAEGFVERYMYAGFQPEIQPSLSTVKNIPWHYISLVGEVLRIRVEPIHGFEDSADYFFDEFMSYEPDKTHGGLFCARFTNSPEVEFVGIDWKLSETNLREKIFHNIKAGSIPFSMCVEKTFEDGRRAVDSQLIIGFPGWPIEDRMRALNHALRNSCRGCLEAA